MWPFSFKWPPSVSIRAQLFLPGGLCPVHSHRSWSCTQTFRKAWTVQSTSHKPGNPALEPSPAAQGLSLEDSKSGCGSGPTLALPAARPPFSQRNILVSSLPEGVFVLICCGSVLRMTAATCWQQFQPGSLPKRIKQPSPQEGSSRVNACVPFRFQELLNDSARPREAAARGLGTCRKSCLGLPAHSMELWDRAAGPVCH